MKNQKRYKLAAVMGLLSMCLFCLVGCGKKLNEGTIYDKERRPATTTMILMPITVSNGKTSTTTMVPMWFFYPERWAIRIEQNTGDKCLRETWWVDRSTYDQATIGGWFQATGDHCTKEPRQKTEEPDS